MEMVSIIKMVVD